MPKIATFLVVMAVSAGSGLTAKADDEAEVSYVSFSSGKAFVSEVTAKALERTPLWNQSAANPPLSAHDAIKVADAMRRKLVHDTEEGNWVREAIELRQATNDRWYWLARYNFEEDGVGPRPDLILLVLMDGTVVTPRVEPETRFSGHLFGGSGKIGSPSPSFFLHGTKITDEGLAHIRGWTQVRALQQVGDSEVTDAGLEHLKGLAQLEGLGLYSPKITDAGLEHLKGLTQLVCLSLSSPKITDAGLRNLSRLTKLENLQLEDCGVTDAGLENLKELRRLKYLYLKGTRVTGVGLGSLKGLERLQELNLEGARVTDVGMATIQDLSQLEILSLRGNQVTDAGLEHLRKLKNLTNVDLRETQVTEQGVKSLQQSLPKCRIQWEPPTKEGLQRPPAADQPK